MMNVCFYITNIARTGGEERMCALLANELDNRGYNVMVVSQNNYWWQKPFFKYNDSIHLVSLKRTLFDWGVNRLFKGKNPALRKYRRLLEKNDVKLVIDVDTERSLETVAATEGLNIRTISWEHFCFQRFSSREISARILECVSSKIDRLVVLTKADFDLFMREGKMPESKLCQIYNPSPIEVSEYIPHTAKKVLSMGRLESEKGIDILLKVWAEIESKTEDWTLEIVGEGALKEQLVGLAGALGLKRVEFSPFTPDPRSKYESASVFVLPSWHEGFSLSLLEAFNMSLPVVAFDCPNGPKELVVDGVNGFLVTPGSIEGFTERLFSLMDDDSLRESFSHNALGTVEKFKKSVIMKQWDSLLHSLVSSQ